MAKDAARAKAKLNASKAHRRVVDAVRSGTLRQAQTGTVDGNVVARLIAAGVLVAEHTMSEKAERTHWGRRIPACRTFIGLRVA